MKKTSKIITKKKKIQNKKPVTVAVSGGFDPIHVGHIRMIQEAAKLGDRLVVIINNDNWLHQKKGYAFMPEKERAELILGIRGVDEVMLTKHEKNTTDRSVCNELRILRPNIFANGGDRTNYNIPELAVCDEIGCKLIFSIGDGGKMQSSSWLLKNFKDISSDFCECGSMRKKPLCCKSKK